MTPGDVPHHPFDRALREAWRDGLTDVVEVLCGRPLPAGSQPLDARTEQGVLEVEGLVADADGALVHVELQTRADPALGLRMLRYWVALTKDTKLPPPDQHVVLLHPDADRAGIGSYRSGRASLDFAVHRLWETSPEALFSRPRLLRLVPLCKAPSLKARLDLIARAARAIHDQLPTEQAAQAVCWMAQLATLYLYPADLSAVLERSHMPIDMSNSFLVLEAKAEATVVANRDAVRRVAARRFGDEALAGRAAAAPADLLEEAIDVVATASPEELVTWLDSHNA